MSRVLESEPETEEEELVRPLPEEIKIWEAENVTSAAPTYFPTAKVPGRVMIDVGVACNDPAMVGYGLARATGVKTTPELEFYQWAPECLKRHWLLLKAGC